MLFDSVWFLCFRDYNEKDEIKGLIQEQLNSLSKWVITLSNGNDYTLYLTLEYLILMSWCTRQQSDFGACVCVCQCVCAKCQFLFMCFWLEVGVPGSFVFRQQAQRACRLWVDRQEESPVTATLGLLCLRSVIGSRCVLIACLWLAPQRYEECATGPRAQPAAALPPGLTVS